MKAPSNLANFLSKKFLIIVFVIVSLLCIIFFAAVGRFNAPWATRIAVGITAPFQSVASAITHKLNDFRNYVGDVYYVYDQNRQLKAENDSLKSRVSKDAELESENARLRQLLNYKNANTQFDLLPASVIGRNSSSWTSHIIINRGSDDGVQKDMPVVTPDGLVGIIRTVYGSYSEVELITDPRSAVGAIVQRADSRVAGVVKGSSASSSGIDMTNLPQNSNVVEGDVIVTSGYGGIYPKGIPIGTVAAIKNDTGGLLQYAALYPYVDFQKLEDVAVIVNSREPAPAPPAPTLPNGQPDPNNPAAQQQQGQQAQQQQSAGAAQ